MTEWPYVPGDGTLQYTLVLILHMPCHPYNVAALLLSNRAGLCTVLSPSEAVSPDMLPAGADNIRVHMHTGCNVSGAGDVKATGAADKRVFYTWLNGPCFESYTDTTL